MYAGQQALGGGGSAIQALDDLGEGVADLRFLLDGGFEGGEDGRVEEAGVGHGWLCGAFAMWVVKPVSDI